MRTGPVVVAITSGARAPIASFLPLNLMPAEKKIK